LRVDRFTFQLPEELIATRPPEQRDGARLLDLDNLDAGSSRGDRQVRELADLVEPGTLLVVNDTRVLPARLLGRKSGTGGGVELLLVRHLGAAEAPVGPAAASWTGAPPGSSVWTARGKSSKPLRPPVEIAIDGGGELAARVLAKLEDGLLLVALWSPAGLSIEDALTAHGHMPLPPYMKRPDEPGDRERYQTVFARVPGAVAAPTAGLHLSTELLARLEARGVELASVTLHVGLGTFRPVAVDDLDAHPMHEEELEIPASTAAAVGRARARGAKVMAVGTTVVRALESAADGAGGVLPGASSTRLLIQPGYRFTVVDALLTNFHLPRSTLLSLVCAFGGLGRVLAGYRHAVAAGYRFYSYGDAMLLSSRVSAAEAAS
jgi:S-adenosylmethionine:tRNA ribosyltransferase-isomerase